MQFSGLTLIRNCEKDSGAEYEWVGWSGWGGGGGKLLDVCTYTIHAAALHPLLQKFGSFLKILDSLVNLPPPMFYPSRNKAIIKTFF